MSSVISLKKQVMTDRIKEESLSTIQDLCPKRTDDLSDISTCNPHQLPDPAKELGPGPVATAQNAHREPIVSRTGDPPGREEQWRRMLLTT